MVTTNGAGDRPEAVVTTSTAVNVATPDDASDGVVPEPGRGWANLLWFLVIVVLCLAVLGLTAAIVLLAFTPQEPPGAADAATLVAVLGSVLTALVGFFSSRNRR
jgi:hypothetical protein